MAKQSGFLAKLEAKYQAKIAELEAEHQVELTKIASVTAQIAKDASDMAANDVFGLGEGRAEAWTNAFSDYFNDILKLVNEDCKDDPDIVYSKAKVDGRLKQINGKHFQPWAVRYEEDGA